MNNPLLGKASEFVFKLFKDNLPLCHVYHDYKHTQEVVETTEQICEGLNVIDSEREALMFAAWFHDVGFIDTIENHEEKSTEIAEKFLRENNYPSDGIEIVKECILVTRVSRQPKNLLEEIIRDADISHFGKESFIARNDLLRSEWETCEGRTFTELEWLKSTHNFFVSHPFYTQYSKTEFELQRKKNLHYLEKMIESETSKLNSIKTKQ